MRSPWSTPLVVERILSERARSAVRVVEVEELATGRGPVERVTCAPSIPGIGSTVIVKRREGDGFDATNLGTEAAALDLLAGTGGDVAPRLLGGGSREGFVVMTDLGHTTLESILFGHDPAAARQALVATGEALARLHGTPVDRAPFRGLGTWTLGTRESGWDVVKRSVRDLVLPPLPPAAADEHRHLMNALRSPGASTVMSHGDLTPNNVIVGSDSRCRLIDFEGAGPQHIGIDACMLRFPFAWYGRWALVPPDARSATEQAYRSSLGVSEADLERSLAVGCTAMAFLRLERLPRIADLAQSPDLALRRREQIASTLEVTVEVCSGADAFPVLASWLQKLLEAIRERWPEARGRARLFPAFGQPRSS